MRTGWLVIAAGLAVTLPQAGTSQETPIVVTGVAARVEIERILNADNLDTESLDSRAVADALAAIPRGRAPDDFWAAYEVHVRAWREFADAEEAVQRVGDNPSAAQSVLIDAAQKEAQIETTFDEVERIALSYGARMPIPPYEVRRIT